MIYTNYKLFRRTSLQKLALSVVERISRDSSWSQLASYWICFAMNNASIGFGQPSLVCSNSNTNIDLMLLPWFRKKILHIFMLRIAFSPCSFAWISHDFRIRTASHPFYVSLSNPYFFFSFIRRLNQIQLLLGV